MHPLPEMPIQLMDHDAVAEAVRILIDEQPVVDMHTHLYPPSFGQCMADPQGLMLWGIDELLTYHYLVAEVMRTIDPQELTPEQFYALPRPKQAELIWQKLFVERSPVSEACRGVLTTLQALGLDAGSRDLNTYRAWFVEQDPDEHISRVMELAGVERITMTNDPFDATERRLWQENPAVGDDSRFAAVLRIDPLLVTPGEALAQLSEWGYEPDADGARRFLSDWIARMKPVYLAASLPPHWRYPAEAGACDLLEQAVVNVCREHGLPFAMMIGVERQVNPAMRLAGDMGFAADVHSVVKLAAAHADVRFFITMLSLENQHELAVAARKCPNLMPFGCWWFVNTPASIDTITRLRMELLGTSFIPQHSDCRVLEQLIYKWSHSRRIIAKVLSDKYCDLIDTGWKLTLQDVQRDVGILFKDNYLQHTTRPEGRPRKNTDASQKN